MLCTKPFLFFTLLLCFYSAIAQHSKGEENFDKNWLFARYGLQANGDSIPEPQGLEAPSINDAGWRKLDLPHDWGIEGPFRIDLDGYTGKLPWRAIGWYRKHFMIASSEKSKNFYIDFDGAMANAEVWLNGHKIGWQPYGYSSFRVELTPYLLFGKEDVIAVRLNTQDLGSRWYPGAGIYRHVRLIKVNPIHVAHWGVFVSTPLVTEAKAVTNVEIKIKNNTSDRANITYSTDIFQLDSNDVRGKKVVQGTMETIPVPAAQSAIGHSILPVTNPELWSLGHPNRYLARVRLYKNRRLIDEYSVPFGIRTIQFTHDNGFLLNGKRVRIQGTCNHHDEGALGTAVHVYALKRQLTILKQMGCNALRTSHNPPAPELLELADKMGFLVMDEAFDCFEISKDKNKNDYARWFDQWHEKDLTAMVQRDRNHPSIILWSMGNEIPEQHIPAKFYLFGELRDIIKKSDTTRPVTCGISLPKETMFSGLEKEVDVCGMNYPAGVYGGPDLYGRFLHYKGHEHLAAFASESASTISSRAVYFDTKYQVSSYDLVQPGWGSLPDEEFKALDKYPAVCGEFVWTGFDYLGEPTPFNSDASVLLNYSSLTGAQLQKEKERLQKVERNRPPSRSSYFGIVDLAGFPKDRYYLYQARWRPDFPMVHILPHWNFPDRIGKITPVFVYTSGDEVELFLNGKSLGRKKKDAFEYRFRWDSVRYEPGELKAVAYKNGKLWSTSIVKTTGAPAKLKITPDKTVLHADGEDLIFATISVTDANGLMVPTAENKIECSIKGDGTIVATDNGDATCLITFSNPVRPAFNGLLLAIIRAKPGARGNLEFTVSSDGLKNDTIRLHIK